MKKLVLKAAFAIAIGVFAGTTVYNTQKPEAMSEVALANVEALANSKEEGVFPCENGCLTTPGHCFCREYFPYEEATWN